MMAENLPGWARKEIDSICRKFFWVGSEASVQGKCMVAWPTVCEPTQLGGLGINDLKLQGFALQTRWLWLQKIDQDRAWSQLPIKTAPEVQAFFRASTFTTIGDGKQALFWEDRWINGETAMEIAPCLYHLVPSRIRQRQSVREGLTNRNWVRGIPRGLSVQALIEYLHLWDAVSNVQLIEQPDRTIWRWTGSTPQNQPTTCYT